MTERDRELLADGADEVPVEDALEQRAEVAEGDPDAEVGPTDEADEADRAEQARAVGPDDDDYR